MTRNPGLTCSLLLRLALPFLRNAHVLLYPLTGLFLVYVLSIIVRWNFTQMIVMFYEYRVGHKRLP